jgi:hypothetical protein
MEIMEEKQCISEAVKVELKEKYIAIRKLIDEDSKNDLETEPYKSKYAAIDILKNMLNLLLNSIDNAKQQEDEVTSMLACVYLLLGILFMDTKELNNGQDYLNKCIDVLNKIKLKSNIFLIKISALNQLGILWSELDQNPKAREYFELAEKEFKNYKSLKEYNLNLYSMYSLFGINAPKEETAIEIIEKLHTLTLYYLAQVYGYLDHFIQSAVYCHMTLKRQLEMNDFDSIDWALNAASLSQFFIEKKSFKQARHHLAAATYIIGKYEDSLKDMR